jgi:hypothetical protein
VIVKERFGLDIEFIDSSYTQLGNTINYSAIADHHNPQITTAPAKSFPVYIFTIRFLTTASNTIDSSAPHAEVLSERRFLSNFLVSSQTPVQN